MSAVVAVKFNVYVKVEAGWTPCAIEFDGDRISVQLELYKYRSIVA